MKGDILTTHALRLGFREISGFSEEWGKKIENARGRGFDQQQLDDLGIPNEADFLEDYRRRVGRPNIPNWKFFIVFSLFRSAAILAGVYRRSVDGQGVDARMADAKKSYQDIAARAWEIAQGKE